MKAVVYEGERTVNVKDMPDARIERPTDVLVRITTTNICGSDLHMYEGRTDMEPGRILGHENLGEARPSFVVSQELPLDAAPAGYEHFDRRDPGWTKVVMHPDGGTAVPV